MIHATILTGKDRQKAETFIRGTKHVVCLSDIIGSVLAVSVSRTAFMQVKIDEEEILGVEVKPDTRDFDLAQLLTRPKKPAPRRSLFQSLRRSEPEADEGPARLFTLMFRDGGPTARIVATYEFQLLEAHTFTSQYSSHFDLVEGVKKPARFTTDARNVATARDCWHCGAAVKPGTTCRNCGNYQPAEEEHAEDE
jgi:ribosomal protein L32